jgi:hypothetical protein
VARNLRHDPTSVIYPKYPRRGWIGVDLDGTLATQSPTQEHFKIGPPVPHMLLRVQHWLRTGRTVKIFTARANDPFEVSKIHEWCEQHGLPPLEVTCKKDHAMIAIWDDRAVGVVPNLGIPLLPQKLGLWKRLKLCLNILLGRASGMKAVGAIVSGRSTYVVRDHLRDMLDLGTFEENGAPKRPSTVFAETLQ